MDARRLVLLVVLLTLVAQAASAVEIIVLNESKEKVYALEDVLLSGDLSSNRLMLTGRGEVIAGEDVKVYLFGPASDVLVENLNVNGRHASVSFDSKGYFFLAQEGDLKFNGDLAIRTIGQVRLQVPGPMNQLRFRLQHGYVIDGDRYGLYEEEVVLQRAEEVAMVVDGSFRFTYAERDSFLYQINYKAFGSSLGGYTLDLLNGETVVSVTGAAKWEQKENKLVLELEGDTAAVAVRGYFRGTQLRVPLPEDRHHVLIESDPEKKITVSTTAKEIDVSKSTIPAQYPNARAWLARRSDVFHVTVKQLGLLPSLAASVRQASNRVAITKKGSVLGEITYSYANTGVDYIEVDAPGDPLYASTQSGAVKLTKDEKLLLAFPKTSYGSLDVVYFDTIGKLKPIDLVEVPLAKTDLPISKATTQIYLPKDVIVLETFGADGGSELPSFPEALVFIVAVGGLAALLRKGMKFTVYYLVFAAGLIVFNSSLFALLIAVTLWLIVKQHLPEGKTVKWILAGAGALVVVALLLLGAFGVIWQMGVFTIGARPPVQRGAVTLAADYAMVEEEAPAPRFKAMQEIGAGEGAITVPTRTGVLPVKLELPRLGKTVSVQHYLVTKEQPIRLRLLLVAGWLKYLLYVIAVFAGLGCLRVYRRGEE